MKILNKKTERGYSVQTAQKYIDITKPIYSLSNSLQAQQAFVDGKPTGEIVSYKAWFTQENLPPFEIKFLEKFDLPPYLSKVSVEDLEACEVKFNVYFRGVNLKVIDE